MREARFVSLFAVAFTLGCATTQSDVPAAMAHCTSVQHCTQLAAQAGQDGDHPLERRYLHRACDLGGLASCEAYFSSMGTVTGDPGQPAFALAAPMADVLEARDLAGSMCRDPQKKPGGQVCVFAGRFYAYVEPRDERMAKQAFEVSCKHDNRSEGCLALQGLVKARQRLVATPPKDDRAETGLEVAGADCTSCSKRCQGLTNSCSGAPSDCYPAMACVCQCQLELGGCGKSEAALTQCVADNKSQAQRQASGKDKSTKDKKR